MQTATIEEFKEAFLNGKVSTIFLKARETGGQSVMSRQFKIIFEKNGEFKEIPQEIKSKVSNNKGAKNVVIHGCGFSATDYILKEICYFFKINPYEDKCPRINNFSSLNDFFRETKSLRGLAD